MVALNLKVEKLSVDELEGIRELIFFNALILKKAKALSLMVIFKIEHGIPLTEEETFILNGHLKFINVNGI